MEKNTRKKPDVERLLGPDPLSDALRERMREALIAIFEEELEGALGAATYQRTDERCGYRNGRTRRTVTTGVGCSKITLPRGRLFFGGGTEEWRSRLLGRYQRRAADVDHAILGAYVTGGNTRRIKSALSPMLRGAALSRSTVSRITGRLKGLFEEWRERDLSADQVVYLYLDGIGLKVRAAGKVTSVPVLVVLGVRASGEKVVLALELAGQEAAESWKTVMEDLVKRNLGRPLLCIVDGNAGLRKAIEGVWPGVDVQRCTVHKLRNLVRHAPARARDEVRDDFHRIAYAESLEEATAAYDAFLKKWRRAYEPVARSLEEAGSELLTFFRFPREQWKGLRTTNSIERLMEEFRRRVKTQCSLPSSKAVAVVLYGLVASGQIRFRKIDGWNTIPGMLRARIKASA